MADVNSKSAYFFIKYAEKSMNVSTFPNVSSACWNKAFTLLTLVKSPENNVPCPPSSSTFERVDFASSKDFSS